MDKRMKYLISLTLVLAFITSSLGLFYKGTHFNQTITSIHGIEVLLYGKGAYAFMSVMRAGTYIATDIIVLIVVTGLAILLIISKKDTVIKRYVLAGVMLFILYYSISLSFGSPLYHFFLIYIVLFFVSSVTSFKLIQLILKLDITFENKHLSFKKTSYFLIIAGFSSLIWLTLLIPAMISRDYSTVVDINTTEPTFVLDIGYIFPIYLFTGISLFKHKKIGYQLTPVLLTFYTLVGFLVISQTIVQRQLGIDISIQELIVLVFSFALLGLSSGIINYQFLKKIKIFAKKGDIMQ